MKFFIFLVFWLLFVPQTSALSIEELTLADHERIAPQLGLKKAYATYNSQIKESEHSYAVPYAKRVYELVQGSEKRGEKWSRTFIAASLNYGKLLVLINDRIEATQVLKECLDVAIDLYGSGSLKLLDIYVELGHANTRFYGNDRGRKYYSEAIKLAGLQADSNPVLLGDVYFEIAQERLVSGVGSRRKAVKDLEKAYEIFTESLGEAHARTALVAYRLGEVNKLRHKYETAERYLKQSVGVFDKMDPIGLVAQKTHTLLVDLYGKLGQEELATKHCRAAGKITEARKEKYGSGVNVMPLYRPGPSYPKAALHKGIEGYAVVELTVDMEGKTKDIRTLSWHGDKSFSKAAMKTASRFRYAVQHIDGRPVETRGVKYKFTFDIAG